jgi:hypothetical protein
MTLMLIGITLSRVGAEPTTITVTITITDAEDEASSIIELERDGFRRLRG